MTPGAFILIAVLMLGLMLGTRLLAGSLDSERVKDYIHSLGGELLDCSWNPLGPGWFGEKSDRIYRIVYRDRQGRIHRADVKTSMFSGVYLTNDAILSDRDVAAARNKGAWLGGGARSRTAGGAKPAAGVANHGDFSAPDFHDDETGQPASYQQLLSENARLRERLRQLETGGDDDREPEDSGRS